MIYDLNFAKKIYLDLKDIGIKKISENDILLVSYWNNYKDDEYMKVEVLYSNIDGRIRHQNIKIKNDNITRNVGDIMYINKSKEYIQEFKDVNNTELVSIIKIDNTIIYKHIDLFYTMNIDKIKADYTNNNFNLIDGL